MSDMCSCGGAQRIAELTEDFRTPEPCGHMKNFLIGDEHGHFTCTVCRIAELETQRETQGNNCRMYANRVITLEIEAEIRRRTIVPCPKELRYGQFELGWRGVEFHFEGSSIEVQKARKSHAAGHAAVEAKIAERMKGE